MIRPLRALTDAALEDLCVHRDALRAIGWDADLHVELLRTGSVQVQVRVTIEVPVPVQYGQLWQPIPGLVLQRAGGQWVPA